MGTFGEIIGRLCFVALTLCGCGWSGAGSDSDPDGQLADSGGKQQAAVATPVHRDSITWSGDDPPTQDRSLQVVRTRIAARAPGVEARPTSRPMPTVIRRGTAVESPTMGLMWTLEATGAFSLEDAHAFCIGLDLQGHSDWRVPGIAELEEILGSGFRPSMRGGVQLLWSTTAAPERGAYAVDLRSGERTRVAVGMAHVVCVHTFAEHL